jgi:hypothetical protein
VVTLSSRAGPRVLSALVLPWGRVLFGSLVGPIVGVAVLWLAKERQVPTLLKPFPISWQDTGTGVFAFAFVAAALLATVHRNEPGHRTLKVAGIAAAAALVMDIYSW